MIALSGQQANKPIETAADGTPILRGVVFSHPSGGQRIRVYCRNCGTHHVHGWDADDAKAGRTHRSPHCSVNRYKSGYYVAESVAEILAPWEGPSEW